MVARISGCPDISDVKGNFVVTVRRTGTFLVYIYMCVCVCGYVCMCVYVFVYVCVCVLSLLFYKALRLKWPFRCQDWKCSITHLKITCEIHIFRVTIYNNLVT